MMVHSSYGAVWEGWGVGWGGRGRGWRGVTVIYCTSEHKEPVVNGEITTNPACPCLRLLHICLLLLLFVLHVSTVCLLHCCHIVGVAPPPLLPTVIFSLISVLFFSLSPPFLISPSISVAQVLCVFFFFFLIHFLWSCFVTEMFSLMESRLLKSQKGVVIF